MVERSGGLRRGGTYIVNDSGGTEELAGVGPGLKQGRRRVWGVRRAEAQGRKWEKGSMCVCVREGGGS